MGVDSVIVIGASAGGFEAIAELMACLPGKLDTAIFVVVHISPVLKAYNYEAIEVEKRGLKVKHKTTTDYPILAEFQQKLNEYPALKAAFDALTPGRQRAYLLHFAQPKQSKTREARVEKFIPMILCGKGLNDDYLTRN